MKNRYKTIAMLLILTLCSAFVFSQEETPPLYRIVTTDGNIFIGNIIEESETEIVISTAQFGDMRIAKANIRSMKVVRPETLIDGVYWPDNPQSTRYFWSPNGYSMGRGEVYYQNIWILYNQVSFGVTEIFSISTGMLPLFLFSGTPTPVWVVPKLSIPVKTDKVQIGAGAFLGAVVGEQEYFGIAFGSATFGTRDSNINLAMGWGFSGRGWAKYPIANVSFMIRTGPKGYFISENFIFPGESVVVLSAGGRRIIGSGLGLDYCLALPLSPGSGAFVLPVLGLTVPLNKN